MEEVNLLKKHVRYRTNISSHCLSLQKIKCMAEENKIHPILQAIENDKKRNASSPFSFDLEDDSKSEEDTKEYSSHKKEKANAKKKETHDSQKYVHMRCRMDIDSYRKFQLMRILVHPANTNVLIVDMMESYLDSHPDIKKILNKYNI